MGRPPGEFPPKPNRNGDKMRVWWYHLGRADKPAAWKAELARLVAGRSRPGKTHQGGAGRSDPRKPPWRTRAIHL